MDAYIYAFLLKKVLNQAIFTDVDNVVLVFVNIEKKTLNVSFAICL